MAAEIRVQSRFASRVDRGRLGRAVRRALRREKARAALTVYVTSDAELRSLNRRFHGVKAATDVLAFPAEEPGSARLPYIGDVVISFERARAQANAAAKASKSRASWDTASELDLLAVHGVLHLLGYDDRTPIKCARMWKRQAEILDRAIP